jgi:chromosomal replication initiator protein
LLEVENGVAVVATTNPFSREWLEKRHLDLILEALKDQGAAVSRVDIIVKEGPHGSPRNKKVEYLDPRSLVEEPDSVTLNDKYTFETFVIGPSNRFAHAAALSVAESPTSYNPLFIYAGPGLGKTHLLHATGHYFKRLYPDRGFIYVSSERFVNDYINSVRDSRVSLFQKKYRSCDLLMVDDIQFLAGKERTQEEFFHTFNDLYNNNKQIVITCDRPPKTIPTLEERLVSRFEWGLVTDIQPPDLETRIAILRKKAALDGKPVPDDVISLIASEFESNIRELEGALIRVIAYSSLTKTEISIDSAKMVLRSMLPEAKKQDITIDYIIEVTSDYFSISPEQLTSANRSRSLVMARQIAMYLCREFTDKSLPTISEAFGGRHHSTVIHAIEKVKGQIRERRDIYNLVQELTNLIKSA